MRFSLYLLTIVLAVSATLAYYDGQISTEAFTLDTLMEQGVSNKELFKAWHLIFKKEYTLDSSEAKKRFKIFKQNLALVKEHNANPNKSWEKGLNQFSDMTQEEYMEQVARPLKSETNTGVQGDPTYYSKGYYEVRTQILPSDVPPQNQWKAIDWSNKCGPVRDQNPCGCCYAFSALNAIECNYNIAKNQLVDLSRQQVVDCNVLNHGCHGGDPKLTTFYAHSEGLVLESQYSFKNGREAETCKFNKSQAKNYVDGIEVLPDNFPSTFSSNPYYTSAAVYALLQKGALSVSIDCTDVKDYKGGITDLKTCIQSNHAVLLVGYGEQNGKRYWLIKNSWNTWWGEKGYLRVSVVDNNKGNCFLYNYVNRPFVN